MDSNTTQFTNDEIAYRREMQKNYIQNKIKNHLCIWCGNDLGESKLQTCDLCSEKSRKRSKEKYYWFKENRLCPKCKDKVMGTETFCPVCLADIAVKKANMSEEQKQHIAEIWRKNDKKRRTKLEELGLCTKCGKKKDDDRYKKCLRCRLKDREVHRIRNAQNKAYGMTVQQMRKQNGLCPFCGGERVNGYEVCDTHLQIIRSRKKRGTV